MKIWRIILPLLGVAVGVMAGKAYQKVGEEYQEYAFKCNNKGGEVVQYSMKENIKKCYPKGSEIKIDQ